MMEASTSPAEKPNWRGRLAGFAVVPTITTDFVARAGFGSIRQ
jgi:hypothetical protein